MGKLLRGYLSFFITLFVWLAFAGFYSTYAKIGQDSLPLDFSWQIILFTFVLATLLFTVNNNSLNRTQTVVSSVFILSGISMLFGWGVAFLGELKASSLVIKIGAGIFVCSIIPLAWGISMLALEAIAKIFYTKK